jgi:hypothetical protein
MHIHLLRVGSRLWRITIPDLKFSSLVICAVGARDKLLVLALEWEPSFEVVLLCCGIVQGAGDDGYDLVGELECFVKFLGVGDHGVELFPGVFRLAKDELFNLSSVSIAERIQATSEDYLLKLVNTEDTPSILAVRSCLFPETCAVTGVPVTVVSAARIRSANILLDW